MSKNYLGQEINNCGQFLDIFDEKLNRKNSGDTWSCQCYGIILRFKSGQQWELKSTGKKILVEFVYPFLEELEENRKLPIFKDFSMPDGVIDNYDDTYIDLWIWDSKRKKVLSKTKWSMLYLDSIKLFDKNNKEIIDPTTVRMFKS